MPKFSKVTLSRVKDLPIVDVASRYTALKKRGLNHFGLSPFHQEKTPSFCVFPSSNRFKDFSGGGDDQGDVIAFIERVEGLSFTEAVELLANRFNIPLEYEQGSGPATKPSDKLQLFQIYEIAAAYFREEFLLGTGKLQAQAAQKYWFETRKFDVGVPAEQQASAEFQVGFARSNDEGRLASILCKKFDIQTLRTCGLFYARTGGSCGPGSLTLRFSGRLMIPIHDNQGRICAFAGRQIPGIEDLTTAGKEAKYLNSPETPIFSKGSTIFNLHRARSSSVTANPACRFALVEGQLDVIRLWSIGYPLPVGTMGTAITESHLRQLGRYPNGIRVLLDGDTAGIKGALRIVPMIFATETDAVFDKLPETYDPDSFLIGLAPEAAKQRLRSVFTNSLSPVAFAVSVVMPLAQRAKMNTQQKAFATKEIIGMIKASPSPVATWYAIEELARILKIDASALWHELAREKSWESTPPKPPTPPPAPSPFPAGMETMP